MPKTETPAHLVTDTDHIVAWRTGRAKPRTKSSLAATAFTAGSAVAFFVLSACVMSAVFVYYQGH